MKSNAMGSAAWDIKVSTILVLAGWPRAVVMYGTLMAATDNMQGRKISSISDAVEHMQDETIL